MLEESATVVARLPAEAHQELMALWGRLTMRPQKQTLLGAAVRFALAHEKEFAAYLASVKPAENKGET